MIVDGCKVHGNCEQGENVLDFNMEEAFTKFICFIATLWFRLQLTYKEEIYCSSKDIQHQKNQQVCNILFLFLDYGKPEYRFYPLRALVEFLAD